MANYSVGNIEIGVISKITNVAEDIGGLIKKLNKLEQLNKNITETFAAINKLSNGLVKIQKLDFSALEGQFEKVSVNTKKLNDALNDIKEPKFGETATQLNRLANALKKLDNLKDMDFRKMYNSFNTINRIITPFLDKLRASETALKAMNETLRAITPTKVNKADKAVKELGNSAKESNKKIKDTKSILNSILNINKIYFLYNYFKKMLGTFVGIINSSIEFEETLNKFQVSFGDMQGEATKFANQLTYAFNLSTASIMNYMATFNSMVKSLGDIDSQVSFKLSKTLTQLALDYSSLFNVNVENAMNSFQSVLSGSIRPIRTQSGIDVSENTIFQLYREMGGTKTIRNLSQLEKRLLRIYAVQKQMTSLGAIGDLQKTINCGFFRKLKNKLHVNARKSGVITNYCYC